MLREFLTARAAGCDRSSWFIQAGFLASGHRFPGFLPIGVLPTVDVRFGTHPGATGSQWRDRTGFEPVSLSL